MLSDEFTQLTEEQRGGVAVNADQLGGDPRRGARDKEFEQFAVLRGPSLLCFRAIGDSADHANLLRQSL